MNRLVARQLSYQYPGTEALALDSVDANIGPGEIHLLCGANGSGKTTLLRALTGFLPHILGGRLHGELVLCGRSLERTPHKDWVRYSGLAFAEPRTQLSGIRDTVFEEVGFGLENLGVPPAEIRSRVSDVLEQCELKHLLARSPFELSGGEQQRVAVASVLVMGAPFLALDEPTAHVDAAARRKVLGLVSELAGAGSMIAISSHDLEALDGVAHTASVLDGGRIALAGSTSDVFRRAANRDLGIDLPLEPRHAAGCLSGPDAARRRQQAGELAWLDLEPPPRNQALASLDSADTAFVAGTGQPRGEPRAPRSSWAAFEEIEPVKVKLKSVHYRYPGGLKALIDVDFEANPGTLTAVLGRNGSGKTTLLRLLNGLLTPTQGKVLVGTRDAAAQKTHQMARFVAVQFQDPSDQIFATTVEREVAFGPRQLGVSEDRMSSLVAASLSATGLLGHSQHQPYDLHESERRLLTLASVLSMNVPVIALDEPGAGFDAYQMRRLEAVLAALKRAGRTIIMNTHDVNLVARTADRVVILDQGRLRAAGPARSILTDSAVLARFGFDPPPAVKLARQLGLEPLPLSEAELSALLAREE